jgi:hypothetical protein
MQASPEYRPMPTPSPIEPLSRQLTIVIGLTVVGFMSFGLALSFYRTVLFEESLADLERGNSLIVAEIDALYRTLEYVRSDLFKDRFAKENLGKLNPNEKLIIITRPPPHLLAAARDEARHEERREAAFNELLRQMPTMEHWKLYLFHRDRIPQIKEALQK